MGYTLDKFAGECHDILTADPGPDGRQKVTELLRKVLVDDTFVAENFGEDNTEKRRIMYEDPDLGFCICSHVHAGAAESPPHAHGDHWAIYGQVEGLTEMFEWEFVEPSSSPDESNKVKATTSYEMNPGDAFLYNEGVMHSPTRRKTTKLVRIEGKNLDTIKRVYHVRAE